MGHNLRLHQRLELLDVVSSGESKLLILRSSVACPEPCLIRKTYQIPFPKRNTSPTCSGECWVTINCKSRITSNRQRRVQAAACRFVSSECEIGTKAVNVQPLTSPFDRATAERAQCCWANACGISVRTTNSVGVEFMLIPPGQYMRGYSSENILQERRFDPSSKLVEDDDDKQHRTVITRPMYVGIHKVTQAEYSAFMGKNPSNFCNMGDLASHVKGRETTRLPVDGVTWYDCIEACNALSSHEGLPHYYRFGPEIVRWESGAIQEAQVEIAGGNGYRLLTSAEWEFVCRAGTTTLYYYGNDRDESRWHDGQGGPVPVGSDGPNNFGVFDMDSYYREWCFDAMSFDSYAKCVSSTAVDPIDLYNEDLERVVRGLNSCFRSSQPAGSHGDSTSFRLCRTIQVNGNE